MVKGIKNKLPNLERTAYLRSGLTLLERTKGFIVYYDASPVCLGSVLMQHGQIVEYAFRKLKVREKNYPTPAMR